MKIKLPLTLTLLALVVALVVGIVAFTGGTEGNIVSADQPAGVSTVLDDGMPLPEANSKVLIHHIAPRGSGREIAICVSVRAMAAHIPRHPGDHVQRFGC